MTRPKKESITKIQSKLLPKDLIIASTMNGPLVESKHRQIVNGACKIFFKKGYHPTTIRDIAKACGMSMGQLYHYIHSKDDVLYLVYMHMQKVWYDYLKRSNMEQIEDPLQKLNEALHRSLEFMVENKKLIQFIYSESKYLDKKHLRIVLEMDYKSVIGFFRGLLEKVKEQESLKGDLDFLASFIAFLLVFLPLRGWTVKHIPLEKTVDFLYDFIISGLGVTPTQMK